MNCPLCDTPMRPHCRPRITTLPPNPPKSGCRWWVHPAVRADGELIHDPHLHDERSGRTILWSGVA